MSCIVLIRGDANHLPLADKSVSMCLTSPPYWQQRDYGCEGQLGLEGLHDCHGAFTDTPCGTCFVCHLRQVFAEVFRVLHPMGTAWIVLGDTYARPPLPPDIPPKTLLGIPWRVAFGLQRDGWILRSVITWCKVTPMPESVQDRPTSATEMVFLLTKNPTYFFDSYAIRKFGGPGWGRGTFMGAYAQATKPHLGQQPRVEQPGHNSWNYWVLNPEPVANGHYASMPTALARRCILAGTSVYGCCAACGAPWVRHVERGESCWHERVGRGEPSRMGINGYGSIKHRMDSHEMAHWKVTHPDIEHGWRSSCRCDAGIRPAVVLDPFCGSGTTPLVARELGRDSIGVDLSHTYLHNIARERLGLADLARWEGRGGEAPSTRVDDLPLFAREE